MAVDAGQKRCEDANLKVKAVPRLGVGNLKGRSEALNRAIDLHFLASQRQRRPAFVQLAGTQVEACV